MSFDSDQQVSENYNLDDYEVQNPQSVAEDKILYIPELSDGDGEMFFRNAGEQILYEEGPNDAHSSLLFSEGVLAEQEEEKAQLLLSLQKVMSDIVETKALISVSKGKILLQEIQLKRQNNEVELCFNDDWFKGPEDLNPHICVRGFTQVVIRQCSMSYCAFDKLLTFKLIQKYVCDPKQSKVMRISTFKRCIITLKQHTMSYKVDFDLMDCLMESTGYYLGTEMLQERQYSRLYHDMRHELSIMLQMEVSSFYPDRESFEKYAEEHYYMKKVVGRTVYTCQDSLEESRVLTDAMVRNFTVQFHLCLDLKKECFMVRQPSYEQCQMSTKGYNQWEMLPLKLVNKPIGITKKIHEASKYFSQCYRKHVGKNELTDMKDQQTWSVAIMRVLGEYFNLNFSKILRMHQIDDNRVFWLLSLEMKRVGCNFFIQRNVDDVWQQVDGIPSSIKDIQEEALNTWYCFFSKYQNDESYAGTLDVDYHVYDQFMSLHDVNTHKGRKMPY